MNIVLPEDINIISQESAINGVESLFIDNNDIVKVLNFLKNSSQYLFDMLKTLSCRQIEDRFEILYLLYSTNLKQYVVILTSVPIETPEINSVASIYSSANYDEREIYDLFGVKFINHPDLKRILLPQEWKGHPLRKDYVNEDERLRWNFER